MYYILTKPKNPKITAWCNEIFLTGAKPFDNYAVAHATCKKLKAMSSSMDYKTIKFIQTEMEVA